MLKVCHITFSTSGGAGIATCRITDALQQSGRVRLNLLFADGLSARGWEKLTLPKRKTARWHFNRFALSVAKKGAKQPAEPLSFGHFGLLKQLPKEALGADIVHFHWVGGGLLDFDSLARNWPTGLPLVWTLHDLNPVMSCGHYPQARSLSDSSENRWFNPLGRHLVKASKDAKRQFYRVAKVHLVGTSEWLCEFAAASDIGRMASSISKIAYPLCWPEPIAASKLDLKKKLGLSEDRPVVCFGAADISNPRKGFHHVESLMQKPILKTLQWVVFGSGQLPLNLPNVKHFGQVRDSSDLNEIYAASDLLITPSEEEAFGQVAAEALACGTPVICFNNTGTCDFVVDNQTGLVVDPTKPETLENAVKNLLFNKAVTLRPASVQGAFREFWIKNMKTEKVAESYLALYNQIV